MKSRRSKRFHQLFDALPESIKRQAREAYKLLQANPSHPGLRFKPVDPSDPTVYSARVGDQYRVIGVKQKDGSIVWDWIGTHAEYDKLV